MPEMKPEDRFSVEEVNEGKSAVRQKGSSDRDLWEMKRVGKKQELRVRTPHVLCRAWH